MRFLAIFVLIFVFITILGVQSKEENSNGENQEYIEQLYQNRRLRSLANGRWQLRPGKRFSPDNSYYYQMMLDN
ncbi:hypothetical protein Mgra_00000955 [Meloidogyne graminicola]|uniref:Uncharacterized protein n=1 Tax=Meloidogyne graminicola TaxID=189291 RepID=A0A8T0A218_9BILA|nr:hypothetical protein Mgra_00000955 [Meloidogyne graminicola]